MAFAAAAAVFGYWLANRRRLAAETVGRAEEQASRHPARRRARKRRAAQGSDARGQGARARAPGRSRAVRTRPSPADYRHRADAGNASRDSSNSRQMRGARLRAGRREQALSAREQTVATSAARYARARRAAASRARTRRRHDPRRSPRAADQGDGGRCRREAASLVTRIETRSPRAGRRQGPRHRHPGHSAQRRRPRHRDHRHRRGPAQRRDEGPHHRARGAQHPRDRAGDRR